LHAPINMPAIQLARLKIKSSHLAKSFINPPAFITELHQMLDFYADRTHRPGQAGEPPPLVQAYHVPQPVLKQILSELKPIIITDPEAALALSDQLWKQSNMECRLLTASILGTLPITFSTEVIKRIQVWINSEAVIKLIEALLNQGLSKLRQEDLEQYIHLVEEWLTNNNPHAQTTGLRALVAILNEPWFDNLPIIYRLVTPLVRIAPSRLRPDLIDVLLILVQRYPQETAYFLRQNLNTPDNPDTPWVIRQILEAFPPAQQQVLKGAMH